MPLANTVDLALPSNYHVQTTSPVLTLEVLGNDLLFLVRPSDK